jgi:hypothetical protein
MQNPKMASRNEKNAKTLAATIAIIGKLNPVNSNTKKQKKNPILAANIFGPAFISFLGNGKTFSNCRDK